MADLSRFIVADYLTIDRLAQLGGAVTLTIDRVEFPTLHNRFSGVDRVEVVVSFHERPERLVLSPRLLRAAVSSLGDESDAWSGRRVRVSYTSRQVVRKDGRQDVIHERRLDVLPDREVQS